MDLDLELDTLSQWKTPPTEVDHFRMERKVELLWQCHCTLTWGPEINRQSRQADQNEADQIRADFCAKRKEFQDIMGVFLAKMRGEELTWITNLKRLRDYQHFECHPIRTADYQLFNARLIELLESPDGFLSVLSDDLFNTMTVILRLRRTELWMQAYLTYEFRKWQQTKALGPSVVCYGRVRTQSKLWCSTFKMLVVANQQERGWAAYWVQDLVDRLIQMFTQVDEEEEKKRQAESVFPSLSKLDLNCSIQ